jgi:hypothetical protein
MLDRMFVILSVISHLLINHRTRSHPSIWQVKEVM